MAADLGGTLSDATTAAIRRAAELFTICEQARANWIAGDLTISASELATLDNALKRALEYLGMSANDISTKAGEPADPFGGLLDDEEPSDEGVGS